MNKPVLTAVTGGIGAGKSVVCRMLRCMGFPVYDCDERARAIIAELPALQKDISEKICKDAFREDGSYNRKAVADAVFADEERRRALNALVHAAVFADIIRWRNRHSGHARLFVESAILYTSDLWHMVDDAWIVEADEETRIARVMLRSHMTGQSVPLSPDDIRARMAAQAFSPDDFPRPYSIIVNDSVTPLLPQVLALLDA